MCKGDGRQRGRRVEGGGGEGGEVEGGKQSVEMIFKWIQLNQCSHGKTFCIFANEKG